MGYLEQQENLKNKKPEKRKKSKKQGMSRRDFLRLTGTTAIGAAIFGASSFLSDKKIEKTGDILEGVESDRYPVNYNREEESIDELYEDLGRDKEMSQSTEKILDYNIEGDIKLTPEKMKSVEQYWENIHSTEGNKLHKSFVDAFYSIGEFEPELRKIFSDAGVPEKYIYLAIPESYWDLDAISPVKAKGPYQFMKATAKEYGLYNDKKKYDYRTDPFKSAKAAAELLSDLYKASGDWDLALSGYNGGHIWRYLKENRKNPDKPSYEGFLKYIEGKINNVKNELKYRNSFDHVVKSSLGKIAKRYGISVRDLSKYNNIEDPNKIQRGAVIKIPLINDDVREKIYNSKIAGYRENLNYPAKFNGIYKAIQEKVVIRQKEAKEHTVYITKNTYPNHEKNVKKTHDKYFVYKAKKGENLFRIFDKHARGKIGWNDFQKLNKEVLVNGLDIGDEVKIPRRGKA